MFNCHARRRVHKHPCDDAINNPRETEHDLQSLCLSGDLTNILQLKFVFVFDYVPIFTKVVKLIDKIGDFLIHSRYKVSLLFKWNNLYFASSINSSHEMVSAYKSIIRFHFPVHEYRRSIDVQRNIYFIAR